MRVKLNGILPTAEEKESSGGEGKIDVEHGCQGATMKDVSLALKPPMGWNSWNIFRCYQLTEEAVLGIADAMVESGMRDAGYEYLVVDDCWQAFARESSGKLRSHPARFPSGMEALGEQIHARGLKFGLYLSPGHKTCAMIYDRYPARDIGSFEHEQLDADTLAGWGVDYLKYDWCEAGRGGTGLTYPEAFSRMAEALARTGRPIVYSISEYGRTKPWEWAADYGHLWRTTPDIGASWRSVMKLVDRQHGLAEFAGPGGWNDPDMLEVGNVGINDVEARSHFMLWVMLAAPLMAGNDLRTMTAATRHTLTHPGLIALSQDSLGRQGSRVARQGKVELWRRELADGRVHGILNRGGRAVHLQSRDGGIVLDSGRRLVTDDGQLVCVWTGEPIDADGWSAALQPHEMILIRSDGRH
ncbi:glycoside hydrolase family 27 protein [Leifsonia psychrotolerans]|uniref:glycoside hydrolase family 27 protein n=1 Tax=Glaciibacter psychrotolerans TaxID=670054 RepID=UPI001C546381